MRKAAIAIAISSAIGTSLMLVSSKLDKKHHGTTTVIADSGMPKMYLPKDGSLEFSYGVNPHHYKIKGYVQPNTTADSQLAYTVAINSIERWMDSMRQSGFVLEETRNYVRIKDGIWYFDIEGIIVNE